MYVIAGPIYDKDIGSIGPNRDIPVPSKDFKIVFILNADQKAADINQDTPYVAVIMPNILKNGKSPVPYTAQCGGGDQESPSTSDDWKQYKTTLADVETQAALSFSGF